MSQKIYFATDHAGFELKNELLQFVESELGFEVEDCGAYTYNENDDYIDFIVKAARAVSDEGGRAKAIILGGSGEGEAMLANRFSNVRATVYYGSNPEIIKLSRVHNDANVLSLGARFLNVDEAKSAVRLWLGTEHPSHPKYDYRIQMAEELSKGGVVTKREPVTQPESLYTVVPSLPAHSFNELSSLCEKLRGVAKGIQVDIVDGVFVPHISWPFTEEDVVVALQKLAPYAAEFEIEMDCMCMYPESYLDAFQAIGVKRVIVHAESTKAYAKCISHAREYGYKIGFAITNDTPLEEITPYLEEIDFMQVMGIENIGVQGQPFDERTIDTVTRIKGVYPELQISVDGGVNADTIMRLKDAGVTRFAPGSAITKANDPALAYKQLLNMVAS